MPPSVSRLRLATTAFFRHRSTTKSHSHNLSSFRFSTSTNAPQISPKSILFEGCDFNHWLIVVDFSKHTKLSQQQMLHFYEDSAARIFGSLEEAKKKMYACCTTAYTGFQVECSEETAEKFRDISGVTFVLPDSYIDPVKKEYGGDKYIDGQIIHRPQSGKYGRLAPRIDLENRPCDRDQTEGESRNYGSPGTQPSQNFGQPTSSPSPQNFRQQTPQKNKGQASRAQEYHGPPQNFPWQNFGPSRGGVNPQGGRRDQ